MTSKKEKTTKQPKKKISVTKFSATARLVTKTYHDVEVKRGTGGETRQQSTSDDSVLTTQQGMPVGDNQNTLAAGAKGPHLLEDFVMREKIFHFDHERIPERVVHARGYGAKGYFETYGSVADITCADLFQREGEKTDVFVRFSTVAGNAGSPDLARDVRGFAVKFYTKQGNWDLVGNNVPVFFIQDAMKFPDLIHAAKPEPDSGFPQAQTAHDNFWDFISLMPESTHMALWAMSDRTIPRGFRFMEGFGVHTFRFISSKGKSSYVKFHWKPKYGVQSVLWDEAVKINGADPDFHRRDLWNAIEAGDYPEWELGVQIFDDKFADAFEFDVLDATKLIPEELVPVTPIGRMVLDQRVDNFFAETEQVAFCTQNIVPGIDFTNDPLLQGRNFSYLDTQLKRLGSPNFTHLPVNAPRCPMAHFQQDGHMAMTNPKGRANYEPNSWGKEGGPRESAEGFKSYQEKLKGDKRRARLDSFADHYSQARQFYRSQTEIEQKHIIKAFVFELSKVKKVEIRERMVAGLINVDKPLAQRVANGLGMEKLPRALPVAKRVKDLDDSPALSILTKTLSNVGGRTIGVLLANGVDAKVFRSLQRTSKARGLTVKVIAPTVAGIHDDKGKSIAVDEKIGGGPSVLYDAVAVLGPFEGSKGLNHENPAVKEFVTDAHAHFKFVGYSSCCKELFNAAGVSTDMRDAGYQLLDGSKATAEKFVALLEKVRHWPRESK